MSDPIWRPSPERIADSNMMRFLDYVRTHYALELSNYEALYDWSIESPQTFWSAVWRFCGVQASREWDSVLVDGDKMPGARWFSGSRLNFAQNMLRQSDEHLALVF